MSKIFVIIPVFNRWRYTYECVDSLLKQQRVNMEIILVDSGSTDGTDRLLGEIFGQTITYIRGDTSWWWTKSTNVGVDYALGLAEEQDYILLMNNDCFVGQGYLAGILQLARRHPKSIIGSICLDCDNKNKVVEAGIAIDWMRGTVKPLTEKYGSSYLNYRNLSVIKDSDALPGKGSLIPVKVVSKMSYFSASLPHYLADYEYSQRVRKHGYKVLIQTKHPVFHHWKATGNAFNSKKRHYSYHEVWQLLFGRKSMNNVADWLNFIRLACPPQYKWLNILILFKRIVARLGFLTPFCYFVRGPVINKFNSR